MQTAVIGGRNSGTAIILPADADELEFWRRRHPRNTYWCGSQLGGCGSELSDRLYRDKVCHFAHRPNTSCHRTATGASSADHLFIKEDLAGWAGRQKLKGRASLRNLGTGPGDAVDFRVSGGRQHLRFQFSRLSHQEWTGTCSQLAREAASLDWIFGPGSAHHETMEAMYDQYGFLLRFRFETLGAARCIRIRAEEPRSSTDWVRLDACAMTPEGLNVPGAVRRRTRARPRPSAAPGGATKSAVKRSREQVVAALREALIAAARLRTRPTWDALCRSAGADLQDLPDSDRLRMLVEVDTHGRSEPMLSALLRADDGNPPPYVAEVVAAVGCGVPASATVLRHWCQREADRVFAVHGVPSRTAPLRLQLASDGTVGRQGSEVAEHRMIVHVQGGPVLGAIPRRDVDFVSALRGARQRGSASRIGVLLKRADEEIDRAPQHRRAAVVEEVKIARRWLEAHPVKRDGGRKTKKASRGASQPAVGRKAQPKPKRKPKSTRTKKKRSN
ncbi:competence protein CoiA family protein [Streptomyces sp. NBC_00683]|uniref:competence protein CoiA family protein n=1 Tax=Streptomyces sp. NBC_00683 TaxID=2903670 RepID=UPI002E3468D5|nr:competence protein CoiA family protein [Streptomyces sp. NBC_00683]